MRNREPSFPFAASACEVMAALWESRLFPGEELRRLSAERSTDDGPAWTQDLVRRGVLTPFQAEQLLAGNGDRLALGGYRILERLGEGGMGQVFRAEHQLMKRVVALKVIAGAPFQTAAEWRDSSTNFDIFLPLHRNACLSPDDLAAFHREVRAAGRLRHPNIVTAYDAAEDRGVHFLVMEYVPGVDLARLVRETGPLPVALACGYIRQAAQGLQYAYEQGVVHRDIKPSNLLLTWEGVGVDRRATLAANRHVVKILDLGLARFGDRSREDEGDGAGVLCGTPDFLAPELAEDSRIVDIRADLYSLGCTFYYLLTGHAPFPGGTWTAKLVRHRLEAVPPLTNFRGDVPHEVSTVLDRLLAKDPVKRFQVPADLMAVLPREIEEHEAAPPALIVAPPSAEVRTPDLGVEGTWPTLDDIPLGAADETPARYSRGKALLRKAAVAAAALLASALAGLVFAGLAKYWEDKEPVRNGAPVASINARSPSKPAAPAPQPFEVHGTRFATLPAAMAAANDGDTVTIHGDGPVSMGPVNLLDKAITLQAANGGRPRLTLVPSTEPRPRQALLASNRTLTLVGLDLTYEPPAGPKAPREPVHLVYCENASLRMLDCRLTAPRLTAPVICRQCSTVEMRACRLTAAASGLCIDLSDGTSCEVILNGNQITMEQREGAAVSLWAAGRRPASAQVLLDRNTIIAGRVLACSGSASGPDVTANGNEITFRQALVSQTGVVEPGRIAWRGRDNVYQPADDWLCIDGKPGGVRNLDAWRARCGGDETGSREK